LGGGEDLIRIREIRCSDLDGGAPSSNKSTIWIAACHALFPETRSSGFSSKVLREGSLLGGKRKQMNAEGVDEESHTTSLRDLFGAPGRALGRWGYQKRGQPIPLAAADPMVRRAAQLIMGKYKDHFRFVENQLKYVPEERMLWLQSSTKGCVLKTLHQFYLKHQRYPETLAEREAVSLGSGKLTEHTSNTIFISVRFTDLLLVQKCFSVTNWCGAPMDAKRREFCTSRIEDPILVEAIADALEIDPRVLKSFCHRDRWRRLQFLHEEGGEGRDFSRTVEAKKMKYGDNWFLHSRKEVAQLERVFQDMDLDASLVDDFCKLFRWQRTLPTSEESSMLSAPLPAKYLPVQGEDEDEDGDGDGDEDGDGDGDTKDCEEGPFTKKEGRGVLSSFWSIGNDLRPPKCNSITPEIVLPTVSGHREGHGEEEDKEKERKNLESRGNPSDDSSGEPTSFASLLNNTHEPEDPSALTEEDVHLFEDDLLQSYFLSSTPPFDVQKLYEEMFGGVSP